MILSMIIMCLCFVTRFPMTREEALKMVVDQLGSDDVIISSTGMLSRELFEYRLDSSSF